MTTMTQISKNREHQVRSAVLAELAWTADVNADHIGVAVLDGVVSLSGRVLTYGEKERAVRAAMRVHGVTAVADEIEVSHRSDAPDDADVAAAARSALERTAVLPARAVKVTVSDHSVTLTGEVAWEYQRLAATRAVRDLRGVRSVVNLIRIKPLMSLTPEVAKARITAALVRNAQLDADRIEVAVSEGRVILTGRVSSWAEYRQAEHSAWSCPGVHMVDNGLVVGV